MKKRTQTLSTNEPQHLATQQPWLCSCQKYYILHVDDVLGTPCPLLVGKVPPGAGLHADNCYLLPPPAVDGIELELGLGLGLASRICCGT